MLTTFLSRVLSFLTSHKKLSKSEDRAGLQKKFIKKEDDKYVVNDFIDRKNQSMLASQGKSDFSGSGYNGPGNIDHEKRNSNMSQRNFQN